MATETIPATGGGEHTHSYGSEWKNDADNHWHECSCGDKKDTAAHTAGEWIIDTPATATTDGSMLIYGKEATTQIENSVPYYSVSKWSSNTKMLLLHFHAP